MVGRQPGCGTIFKACETSPAVRGTDWRLLFDGDSVISISYDELECEANVEHPLRSFYVGYSAQLWGSDRTPFTPYTASIPVVSDVPVLDLFRKHNVDIPMFRVAGAREFYRLSPCDLSVGVLTAGGNAPGLNAVVDSIVKRHSLLATKAGAARENGQVRGLTIWGYRNGYVGLVSDDKEQLAFARTDPLSLTPGSMLGIKRGQKSDGWVTRMADALERDALDILYVIGGDGTITAADLLGEEASARGITGRQGRPVRVVAAPKTMDNDVHFTDVTFGFRTTVENAAEVIRRIHLEAQTCGRVGIVELFGAGSGFVALHASYASGEVDYVLLPEMMTESNAGSELEKAVRRLADRSLKRGHALLVVAEGATTRYAGSEFRHGNRASKGSEFDVLLHDIMDGLQSCLGSRPDMVISQPQHLIRSTAPCTADIDLCKETGKLMVDTALAGLSRCVVSLWHGDFVLVPMGLAAQPKRVDVAAYYYLSMVEKYWLD